MLKYSYLVLILFAFSIANCKKEEANPYGVFEKPYSTGVIKFQYQTPTNKEYKAELTTSYPPNGGYFIDGGGRHLAQIQRIQRTGPVDSTFASIGFYEIYLKSMKFPYKFKKYGIDGNAVILFEFQNREIYESPGLYIGETNNEGIELTILSNVDNRLQGTFSGTLKNPYVKGDSIKVKNGLFDVKIEERR